jgi:hypothetical protein
MSTWAETEFKGIEVGENAIIGTTRKGMDDIFEAQDDYIAEHPEG